MNKYCCRLASLKDAKDIGVLVCELTQEITALTQAVLNVQVEKTVKLCESLMAEGKYNAFVAVSNNELIAIANFTETYALYAGGKMGLIHEFYVCPKYRNTKIGTELLSSVKQYGKQNGWSCIELCTPPLPEFQRSLTFYEKNGLVAVGGRKMREIL